MTPQREVVAFILPQEEFYTPAWSGAVATVVRNISRELEARGMTVRVLASGDGTPQHPEGRPVQLRFNPRTPRSLRAKVLDAVGALLNGDSGGAAFAYWRAVRRAVAELGLESQVLVVHDPRIARNVSERFPRALTVLWLHNYPNEASAADLLRLPQSVLVVAVSDSVARAVSEVDICLEPVVIHNAVDHQVFHPADRMSDNVTRVICHGRFDPNKGQDVVLGAVTQLRNEGYPVELTLVGAMRTFGWDEQLVQAYQQRVERGIELSGARSLGWLAQDELAEELRQHDIACAVPRVDEPFGLAALEAMASGCAVVATRLGGLAEVTGTAGLFVSEGDSAGLAEAIRSLTGERLIESQQAAVHRAASFTWSRAADLLLSALETDPTGSAAQR